MSPDNEFLLTGSLAALGVWPLANNRLHRYYRLLLHLIFTLLFTLLMWAEVISSDGLDHAAQVLKFALTETALVLKVYNMWHNAPLTAQLLHAWRLHPMFARSSVQERRLWQRAQRSFRKLLNFYVLCSVSACVCALCAALFSSGNELPFPYWMPAQWRAQHYWTMYGYEALAMLFTCLSNILIDMFQCFVLLQLTLSYRLIGLRLQRVADADLDVQIRKRLIALIRMHQRVKVMAEKCERILSLPALTQIIMSSFIICFTIYRLQSMNFANESVEVFAMIQYGLSMCLQIFLICYFANEVTVASEQLSTYLYCADWTHLAAAERRLIYLYMEQLKQPITLRAGNFFQIGLPIFSKTMNNAYSLLALLANIGDDDK